MTRHGSTICVRAISLAGFANAIKDENLAAAAERVESLTNATPQESRALIRAAVEQDYTVPASLPLPVAGAS